MYLTTPQQITGKEVTYLTILGAEKRANDGVGSVIPLVKELSRKKGEEGKLIDKPLTNLNDFDEIPWGKVSGLQWTDESGTQHTIPKDQFSLTPVENAIPGINPTDSGNLGEQKTPVLPAKGAREILEILTEDPNLITIVGLKAYETRALDLADRSMQKLTNPQADERAKASRNLWEKTKDAVHGIENFAFTTWKQSVGGIYFHEKARQYYIDMLKTAETPFAEDAIRLAERRATDKYNTKLADSNFLVRIGTKAVDWFKDKTGMRTTIQNLALEEIGAMRLTGEIKGLESNGMVLAVSTDTGVFSLLEPSDSIPIGTKAR